jgi:ubiquinone/menaquinone biosynthesis C-methylase UbiE
MKKLHIGCGKNIIPGFINLDLFPINDEVTKCDARILPFDSNSVDMVYSCHILEHFPRKDIVNILKEWNRVMKKGSVIYISVPDFDKVVDHYIETGNIEDIEGFLNGGQKGEWDNHITTFNFYLLKNKLLDSGFNNVRRYDWRETEFKEYDDYSQCYLPHMDKENGKLMSLNVMANKE